MKNRLKKITPQWLYKLLRQAWHFILISYKEFRHPAISPINLHNNFALQARLDFFNAAQYFLQTNRIDGVYLEFGCHEANTFRMALNTLGAYNKPNKVSHFYAFDSFAGMPEPTLIDKQLIWQKGMNFTTEQEFKKLCYLDIHRMTIVPGFFENSLNKFNLRPGEKVACVYIDCDYYSSTVEVLSFLTPLLSHGMIIAFDDWDCYFADNQRGQRKAFFEWTQTINNFKFEPFFRIMSGGNSFIVQDCSLIGTDFSG